MSGFVSDSGTSADLVINSRVVAVVSATSVATVAATTFVSSPNQTDTKSPCIQMEMSAASPIRCSQVTDANNDLNNEDNSVHDNGNTMNLSLMQTSPPPHSYRHSRAYRHFKNPPQPHMCIRTTTETGEELFINVLSWTRIVIPQEPTDPIPLYGGMRVPPGSPRSPPIVFAVMANPEVLKDSGRHSKDPEERRAMVELMCDFVEAMNPGVKLVRNAVILKDRDISGELKDVWNAVQAQRDREREEQMLQQRQQQHFHNVTTQQMFPKSAESIRISEEKQNSVINPEKVNKVPLDSLVERSIAVRDSAPSESKNSSAVQDYELSRIDATKINHLKEKNALCAKVSIEENASGGEDAFSTYVDGKDQIDATNKLSSKLSANGNMEASVKTLSGTETIGGDNTESKGTQSGNHSLSPSSTVVTAAAPVIKNTIAGSENLSTSNSTKIVTLVSATASTTSTKKDKLVGFLPNGCIFPRFKNYKNKEKDKDKEKETKTKEKTLLNALKKSKDKKVAPIENCEKTSGETDQKINYEKNCSHLENEVQKLDLNKIETSASGDNMFVKLKLAATSATAK
ncbi:uncharacterized protein LOC129240552 isoform X1 [Anastrepha obliqua]|uniref:uncharacterized protein LOC129240552 isoform X1 n=1 Tax=Anastrepha obliqua TaxID=95512 RepID=UPI00240A294E|nr:uncharacterized protein LOC129240552 isoform X1 [Anastrepha obliqua]XP_054732417.1 uncharacterized protein LOC129240552 isoform X1 [Anastrepha obliqua]XP_054732418.1 uncharacterized protein LOC129240552 isoform X1 [Anastrepha obliqua]XP_054732419.1 uncharacterized protein LOC129240552 isoform X1 [Anastrepha obliqua]XP_054732420.1 uncharacterized protein LOC129240552 isoform X1 [Anastrepha obliqua]